MASLRHRKPNDSSHKPEHQPQVINPASTLPPHHTLTSLSLSNVQFVPDSLLTEFFAYVTLSPLAIFCGYVAVVVVDRDLKPLVMLAGQVLSEGLNAVMKRIIKQARPTTYIGDGYGMPSSHSQFMTYFATYSILLMYRRDVAPDDFLPPLVSALAVIWAALVVYSRVHLYYHTWQQVVAGTICGIAFALGYYYFVYDILRPSGIFEWIVDQPLARQFYVRDTDAIPDLAKFEWDMWQQFRNTHSNVE
ncbi:dolichyldiphosphatase [Mortierella sp. GBAus27b]|nr:hypothetical protein BGX31_007490 [Mortierella sp. GBA43]KAI8357696.1 dolichyldiphosphatase [Mortierella sp. GBAus27b]